MENRLDLGNEKKELDLYKKKTYIESLNGVSRDRQDPACVGTAVMFF